MIGDWKSQPLQHENGDKQQYYIYNILSNISYIIYISYEMLHVRYCNVWWIIALLRNVRRNPNETFNEIPTKHFLWQNVLPHMANEIPTKFQPNPNDTFLSQNWLYPFYCKWRIIMVESLFPNYIIYIYIRILIGHWDHNPQQPYLTCLTLPTVTFNTTAWPCAMPPLPAAACGWCLADHHLPQQNERLSKSTG